MKDFEELLKSDTLKLQGNHPNSRTYIADFRGKRCLLKRYNTPTNVESEFKSLQEARKILKGKVGVPKAIAYSTKGSAILLEYIKGEDLRQYLRKENTRRPNPELETLFTEIGHGLRQYHERVIGEGELDLDTQLLSLPEEKLITAFKKKRVKRQRVHGNFKAENIIIGKDIFLIDFRPGARSSPYFDLAKLIESVFTVGLRTWPRYSFKEVKRLEEALLQGYFGKERVDRETLALYQILYKRYDISRAHPLLRRIVLRTIYFFRNNQLKKEIS